MWKNYLENMTEEQVEELFKDTFIYKSMELTIALLKFKIEFFGSWLFKRFSKSKIQQLKDELLEVEKRQREYLESSKREWNSY